MGKGGYRPRSRRTRGTGGAEDAGAGGGGEPYLFECVVARDKNDGESLKSMWRSTTTLTRRRRRHRHLAESRKLRRYARYVYVRICICDTQEDARV